MAKTENTGQVSAGLNRYTRLEEAGEYLATLRFTSWGKCLNLGCYFEADDGNRFYLYAWRKESGERHGQYCPREGGPNFRYIELGTRWLITTRLNSKGNIDWVTAEEQ